MGLNYQIIASDNSNSDTVIQSINVKLAEFFNIENFQVGTPVVVSDIANLIINTQDVVSLVSLNFHTISGLVEDREYSDFSVNYKSMTRKGVINPPAGSIIEIRYPEDDITGKAG